MSARRPAFAPPALKRPVFTWGDAVALLLVAVFLSLGLSLALRVSAVMTGPQIDTRPAALPGYALLSLGRMAAAYLLSFLFTLVYGRLAVRSPRSERLLLPLL